MFWKRVDFYKPSDQGVAFGRDFFRLLVAMSAPSGRFGTAPSAERAKGDGFDTTRLVFFTFDAGTLLSRVATVDIGRWLPMRSASCWLVKRKDRNAFDGI